MRLTICVGLVLWLAVSSILFWSWVAPRLPDSSASHYGGEVIVQAVPVLIVYGLVRLVGRRRERAAADAT